MKKAVRNGGFPCLPRRQCVSTPGLRPLASKRPDQRRRLQGFVGRAGQVSGQALTRRQAFNIVKRRTKAAGLPSSLRSHSLRATGITAFLLAGGSLEGDAEMAGHVSTRTTQLYDKRLERASVRTSSGFGSEMWPPSGGS